MADEKKDDAAAGEETTGVSPELASEINGAVESTVKSIEADRKAREAAAEGDPEPEKKDLPPNQGQVGGDGAGGEPPAEAAKDGGKTGVEAEPDAITDTHLERAVKAGMSMADAKTFKSAEALDRMCGMLEAGKKGSEKKGGEGDDPNGKKGGEEPPADPLALIPDLDPEKYDEQVVAGFKAMKEIIRRQDEFIRGAQSEGRARESSWFDGQIESLGKPFVEALGSGPRSKLDPNGQPAAKRAELEQKFKILEAGYKANGTPVDREVVFKEAVSVVLGEVAAKAEMAAKSKSLESRGANHVNRPSGGKTAPSKDAAAEVAAMVDRKFFGKQ